MLSIFFTVVLALMYFRSFNFGIDFLGGAVIEVRFNEEFELAKLRSFLNELNVGEIVIQTIGGHDGDDLSIKIAGKSDNNELTKNVELVKKYLQSESKTIEIRKTDFVGPQVGSAFINSSAWALSLSFIMISAYIALRFEWQFGVGLMITLLHDIIISLGFMSLTWLEFNLSILRLC